MEVIRCSSIYTFMYLSIQCSTYVVICLGLLCMAVHAALRKLRSQINCQNKLSLKYVDVVSDVKQTRDVHPMLCQCWPSVADASPVLAQHWVIFSCLLTHSVSRLIPSKDETFIQYCNNAGLTSATLVQP